MGEPITELSGTQHAKVTPVLSQLELLAKSDIVSQCSEPPLPRYTPHTGPMALRDIGAMTGKHRHDSKVRVTS